MTKVLIENDNLKVLDLSWNLLGKGNSAPEIKNCMKILAIFFRKNKYLLHLDLRYNFILFEHVNSLATALKKNTTLYGLHFDGNAGYVNSN